MIYQSIYIYRCWSWRGGDRYKLSLLAVLLVLFVIVVVRPLFLSIMNHVNGVGAGELVLELVSYEIHSVVCSNTVELEPPTSTIRVPSSMSKLSSVRTAGKSIGKL